MIPEIKVNHWKWCDVTHGNDPSERWEWCEVNEEVDVYTALWLHNNAKFNFEEYVFELGETEWAKKFIFKFIPESHYNGVLTEEAFDILTAFLFGIQYSLKPKDIIYIDEKLYTNNSL